MARKNFPLHVVAMLLMTFNRWTQIIQIQSSLVYPRDGLLNLGAKCAADVDTQELALHELVPIQHECWRAQAEPAVLSRLLAGHQLRDLPAPQSAAALPFAHCTLAVCSYGQISRVSCSMCGFGLSRLSNPFRV